MTYSFQYDKQEVIRGLRYHFLSQRALRLMVVAINVFAIVAAILFFFKKIQGGAFLFFSFLWFALMLVVWRLLPAAIYRKSTTFKDHFRVTANDSGLVLNTGRGEKHFEWTAFSKMIETPDFFHLYLDERSFFLLPKSPITDLTELQDWRALLREKIK